MKPIVFPPYLCMQVINKHPHHSMTTFFTICDSDHLQHKVNMCQTQPRLMRAQMSETVCRNISLFSFSEEFDNPLFLVPLAITLQTIRKHI